MNTGNRHRFQHIAGHAAQDDLTQSGMAVTTHDDQRSGIIGDIGEDGASDVDVGRREILSS